MKIYNIRLKGFQQYNDTFIDFTNPETGEPASKICIIGKNGTGKSTLLNILTNILNNWGQYQGSGFTLTVALKFEFNKTKYFYYYRNNGGVDIYTANIETDHPNWFNVLSQPHEDKNSENGYPVYDQYFVPNYPEFVRESKLKNNTADLLITSPAESFQNSHLTIHDVPEANLNGALGFFNSFPYYHYVSNETVNEFWKILIFLIKKRENERDQYENDVENINKTKSQLIVEFEKINPKILNKIADLWNNILEKAGLEFDVEKADNPIQLNDNLKAYIVLRKTKERISYNNLSTGIRNFIFRIGHIFALYFNKEIKRGFVFIDEPENSLFPDFLFDLVSIYEKILIDKNGENNSQLFMSTHNPIIAAQFEPHERVILDWDDNGYVQAFKGVAPIGDDPNDILLKDFKLTHVMGKKGQEFWIEYLELKKKLRKTTDETEKEILIKEISEIGQNITLNSDEISG